MASKQALFEIINGLVPQTYVIRQNGRELKYLPYYIGDNRKATHCSYVEEMTMDEDDRISVNIKLHDSWLKEACRVGYVTLPLPHAQWIDIQFTNGKWRVMWERVNNAYVKTVISKYITECGVELQ